MTDDKSAAVKAYYDENALKEWNRLSEHPFEFVLTAYMMEKHIRAGDRILDIGGGPGRYAVHFAKMGCEVTLVDLSEGNIALAKEKCAEAGVSVQMYAHNALTLDELHLGEFDHVFLMGPLYHLPDLNDRRTAVSQALKCLKVGGLLYTSFILDFSGFIQDMKNGPGLLPEDLKSPISRRLQESVLHGIDYSGPAFTTICFINQSKIRPFMESFPLETVHLFGQEGFLAPNENQILSYPAEEQALWLDMAKKFLEAPQLLSYSEHAMHIGRKLRGK